MTKSELLSMPHLAAAEELEHNIHIATEDGWMVRNLEYTTTDMYLPYNETYPDYEVVEYEEPEEPVEE